MSAQKKNQLSMPLVSDPTVPTYVCPGELASVSQAVHLARLAAGWSNCEDCRWRFESETLVPTPRTEIAADDRQKARIRRTEFGVRGTYLNAIDRRRASQLAAIAATLLRDLSRQESRLCDSADSSLTPGDVALSPTTTVAVGFDGRRGAPDIFSGVVSTIRQSGCHVVDAGRCTAGSLLNVCRIRPEVVGAVLVTGAGGGSSDTGLDFFRDDGQTVAVPWQEFGVSIRLSQEENAGTREPQLSGSIQEALSRIRAGAEPRQTAEAIHPPCSMTGATLVLPARGTFGGPTFRGNRRSGSSTAVNSETAYREWLLRWWPKQTDLLPVFLVADDLTADRLQWLMGKRCPHLEVRQSRETAHSVSALHLSSEACDHRSAVTIRIEEDDRFLSVWNSRGKKVSAAALADWMNNSVRTSGTHVTAHAVSGTDRLLMVDVSSPDSGRQQDVIADGLAAAGFLLHLLHNGQNPLPV